MNPPLFGLRNRDTHDTSKALAAPASLPGSTANSTYSKASNKTQPIINEGLELLHQASKLLESHRDLLDPSLYDVRAAQLAHNAPVPHKLTKGRLPPREFYKSAQSLLTDIRDAVEPAMNDKRARRRTKASSISGGTIISSYPDTVVSRNVSRIYPNEPEFPRGFFGHRRPKPITHQSAPAPRDMRHEDVAKAPPSDNAKPVRTRHKRSDTVPAISRHAPGPPSFIEGSSHYPYGGLAEARHDAHSGSSNQPALSRRKPVQDLRQERAPEPSGQPSSRSHHYTSHRHHRDDDRRDDYYHHRSGRRSEDSRDHDIVAPPSSNFSDKTRWPGREHHRPHRSEDTLYNKDDDHWDSRPSRRTERERDDRERPQTYPRGSSRGGAEKREKPRDEEEDRRHSPKHDRNLSRRPSYGKYDTYGYRHHHYNRDWDRREDDDDLRHYGREDYDKDKDGYYYPRYRDDQRPRYAADRKYHTYSHRSRHPRRDDEETDHDNDDNGGRGRHAKDPHHSSPRKLLPRPDERSGEPTPAAQPPSPAAIPLPPSITPSPVPPPASIAMSATLPLSRAASVRTPAPISASSSLPVPPSSAPLPSTSAASRSHRHHHHHHPEHNRYNSISHAGGSTANGANHSSRNRTRGDSLPSTSTPSPTTRKHSTSTTSSFSWRPQAPTPAPPTSAPRTTTVKHSPQTHTTRTRAAAATANHSKRRRKKAFSMAISEATTNAPTIVPYPAANAADSYSVVLDGDGTDGKNRGNARKQSVLGKMFGFGKSGKSRFVEQF